MHQINQDFAYIEWLNNKKLEKGELENENYRYDSCPWRFYPI